MAKKSWEYQHVILNYKAKELMTSVIKKLKIQAELAGVDMKSVEVATIYGEDQIVKFEMSFYSDGGNRVTLRVLDLEDFETKFIEFLFSAKKK